MAKIKVFGGGDFHHITGKQCNTVVAATSRQKAVEAMKAVGIRINVVRVTQYWSVTGEPEAVEAAMSDPGAVFQTTDLNTKDYKKVKP